MVSFTDQTGQLVELNNFPPKRIVSLVPSQTELLHALGLENEVVGTTKFCVHPKEWHKNKTKVGGTKDAKIEKILALSPDLVIVNKEENTLEIVQEIKAHNIPVYITNVNNLQSAIEMILELGKLTNTLGAANTITNNISDSFNNLLVEPHKTFAYLIWEKPIMIAANNTYIDSILETAGFKNVFKKLNRYPEITLEQLKASEPEYLFLSSEPFPYKQKHLVFYQDLLPKTKVKIIDGELISWYGSRLQKTAQYLTTLK